MNWDMDQSFRSWNLDSYQYLLERVGEGRRGRNRAEPRAFLLTHLIAEDPEYREYFKRTVQRILNHSVTDAFLMERYQHYLDTATRLRVPNLDYLSRLKDFLGRRRAFFWLTTEQWLNTPPSQVVSIMAPPGIAVRIDGETVTSGYRGRYFPDIELTVDVEEAARERFSGWRVNGRLLTRCRTVDVYRGPANSTSRQCSMTRRQRDPGHADDALPSQPPPIPVSRIVWKDIPPARSGSAVSPRTPDAAPRNGHACRGRLRSRSR